MTHDPFQSFPTLGMYSGAATPFGLPYSAQQTPQFHPAAINPLAAFGQWNYPGIQGYGGMNPLQTQQQLQQQQLVAALIAQALGQSPLTAHLQNPLQGSIQQNPFAQNPLVHAALQNPQVAQQLAWHLHSQDPQVGYAGGIYGQQPGMGQTPYGPIGGQLAPQSWIGQGTPYAQHPFAQVHPLVAQQLAARALQGAGISPWVGF